MTLAYADTLRNTRADAITSAMDAGAGPALIRIYDGVQPAKGGAATTLLAELTCSSPAAPAASGGVLTLSAINSDPSANASGTATWFRVVDSNGVFVMDGTVTATGGGGDLELDNTSINTGQQVSITSFVITQGNA